MMGFFYIVDKMNKFKLKMESFPTTLTPIKMLQFLTLQKLISLTTAQITPAFIHKLTVTFSMTFDSIRTDRHTSNTCC